MNRNRLLLIITAGGLLGGVLAEIFASQYRDLVILGAALVASERFELRPPGRAAIPLSFAVAVVIVPASTPLQFALVIGMGYSLAAAIHPTPKPLMDRMLLVGERLAEAYAIRVAYRLVVDATDHAETRAFVLAALAAAAVAPLIVADVVTAVRERRVASMNQRGADLALVTSAILMSVG